MMLVKHFAQCLMHKYPVNISYYPCYLKMEITCLPQGLQGIVCQLYFKKISEKKNFFKELKGGFRKIRGVAQKRSSLLAVSLLTEPGEDTV